MTQKRVWGWMCLVVGFAATGALACERGQKTAAESKGDCPYAKAAVTVADKTECAKAAEKTAEKSECSKAAVTVAEKPACDKAAEKVADKSGCCGGCSGEPCCGSCSGKTAAAKRGSCGKSAKVAADSESGCPVGKKINAVLAGMPSIQYRVGDEVTGCSKSAIAKAETNGAKVQFVVGDEVFDDEGKAKARLVALLDEEIESLSTIQFVADGQCMRCPVTAKKVAQEKNAKMLYRVGGVDFETQEAADKALQAVREALAEVTMAYKVDGEVYQCSKTAGSKGKAGKPVLFVVGDQETPCETTAKLLLEEAKIRKIVEAAVVTLVSS